MREYWWTCSATRADGSPCRDQMRHSWGDAEKVREDQQAHLRNSHPGVSLRPLQLEISYR